MSVYPGFGCSSFTLAAYPNPATTSLTVAFQQDGYLQNSDHFTPVREFRVELNSDTGKKTVAQGSKSGIVELSTELLPRGLYILKTFFEHEVVTERILLE
jgi:hypothetical protein